MTTRPGDKLLLLCCSTVETAGQINLRLTGAPEARRLPADRPTRLSRAFAVGKALLISELIWWRRGGIECARGAQAPKGRSFTRLRRASSDSPAHQAIFDLGRISGTSHGSAPGGGLDTLLSGERGTHLITCLQLNSRCGAH